jgi:hypothetical protein
VNIGIEGESATCGRIAPDGDNGGVARLASDQSGDIMSTPFQISLAPDQLWQAINPITAYQQGAQFGFINIDLGGAGDSDLERKLLDRVGSYGRQLGRIGDALEVILKHVKLGDLKPEEQDALDILKGQLASVRQVKAERRASAQTDASDATQTRAR